MKYHSTDRLLFLGDTEGKGGVRFAIFSETSVSFGKFFLFGRRHSVDITLRIMYLCHRSIEREQFCICIYAVPGHFEANQFSSSQKNATSVRKISINRYGIPGRERYYREWRRGDPSINENMWNSKKPLGTMYVLTRIVYYLDQEKLVNFMTTHEDFFFFFR